MGLKKDITALVEASYAVGRDGEKIAQRLIEAGIRMMSEEGLLTEQTRIAIADFATGEFYLTSFTPNVRSEAIVDLDATAVVIDDVPYTPAQLKGMVDVLGECGMTFDGYARNHFDKKPPQVEKGRSNVQMAEKAYSAIGVAYVPPSEPGDLPDFRPVESESEPAAWDDPRALLRSAYDASQGDQPMRAMDLQPDHRIVLNTLVAVRYATIDELTDVVGVTATGRDFVGIRPEGVLHLPVEVAEITGNVAETELAARYLEGKVAGIDKAITKGQEPAYSREMSWVEAYQHMAIVLGEAAREIRQGMHLPSLIIDGAVIPYNEDRSTGITHAAALRLFFEDVYARNLKAGWWTEITTGEPKKRNVGELFMLMTTELWEAYEAYMAKAADDKLPEYPGVGVEIGDLLIRVADFAGALLAGNVIEHNPGSYNPGALMFAEVGTIAQRYESIRKTPEARGDVETSEFMPAADIAIMVDRKLDFNAHREDHKIENRLKEGGKQT